MKKPTLFGLIGCCTILVLDLYYVIRNISNGVPAEYVIPNIFNLIAWGGIVYFFVELYKRQK